MKKHIYSLVIILIIALTCAALYWSGNYVVYILVYIFCFVFLFCYTIFSSLTILEKIVRTVVYALVMVVQILFNALVIQPAEEGGSIYDLCQLLGLLFIFIPFLVERRFFYRRIDKCPGFSLNEWSGLSYSQLLHDREMIACKIAKVKKAGEVLSKDHLNEIINELPRHSSFSYINSDSLTSEYFQKASILLNDGYVYLIVTRSKSAAGEIIGLFTGKQYNHVSLSFDQELYTVISYNGGEKVVPPGLNPELLKRLAQKAGSSVMLYRLPATYEQKRIMLDKVREINTEGSAYNLLGLLFRFSHQPNIMFCSQFVYTMLKIANLNYFEKDATHVKPTDFVELDYYRKLEFVSEFVLCETNLSSGDDADGKTNS